MRSTACQSAWHDKIMAQKFSSVRFDSVHVNCTQKSIYLTPTQYNQKVTIRTSSSKSGLLYSPLVF